MELKCTLKKIVRRYILKEIWPVRKKNIADTLGLGGGGANYFMHISLIPLSCGESVFGLSIPEVLVLSLVVGLISGNVDIPLIWTPLECPFDKLELRPFDEMFVELPLLTILPLTDMASLLSRIMLEPENSLDFNGGRWESWKRESAMNIINFIIYKKSKTK